MYPIDVQTVSPAPDEQIPNEWWWWIDWFWDDTVISEGGLAGEETAANGTGAFDCNRAVILCHPDTPVHPPACFIARFPAGGATAGLGPLRITGSGRISETVFTTEPNQYVDEPVIVYTLDGVTKLMLPQELQSTGDDTFVALMRTGLQAAPGLDSHRLEAVEPLLRRGAGVHPGTQELVMAPVTSNILDTRFGSPSTGSSIPALNDASQPVKAPIGVVQAARWLGFTLLGANTNCVFRYLGAILRGRRLS